MSPIYLTAAFEDAFPFLIGFGLFVLVPVVAMMLRHQRQMAEIIHRRREGQADEVIARLDALQRELAEVKHRQNEMILSIDAKPLQVDSVESRVRGDG